MSWLQKSCVIVPIDFSADSFAALDPALAFVERPEQIHALHVLYRLPVAEPGLLWESVNESQRQQQAYQALHSNLKFPPYQGIRPAIATGDPSSEIIDYAHTHQADLIVMPSHGRTRISRFLLGSVAERVVRHAHCPVLILRH